MTFWDASALVGIWALILSCAHFLTRQSPFFREKTQGAAPGEIVPLNSLRGILAFSVFFSHVAVSYGFWRTGVWVSPNSYFLEQLAAVPVLLFFYLSGFLFWSKLMTAHESGKPFAWARFFRSRFCRMVPAYLVSFGVVLFIVSLRAQGDWKESFPKIAGEIARWVTFGIPDGTFPAINQDPHSQIINAAVTWTLRYEWLFIFSLPLLFWFAAKHRLLALMPLLAAVYFILRRPVFGTAIADGTAGWYVHTILGFLTFLGSGFGGGMLTAYFLRLCKNKAWLKHPAVTVVLLASLCGLFYGPIPWLSLPLHRTLLLLVFMPIAAGNTVFGFLEWRTTRALGLISYSIYLFHGIVLYTVTTAVNQFYPIAEMEFSAYWLVATIAATTTVFLSAWVFRGIEYPSMQRGPRYGRSPVAEKLL
ncbi:acyltransferase [bacterium]|nr:acyltransferase [bacterium]